MGDGRSILLERRYLDHATGVCAWWEFYSLGNIHVPEIYLMTDAVHAALKSTDLSPSMRHDFDRFGNDGLRSVWLAYEDIVGWAELLGHFENSLDIQGYRIRKGLESFRRRPPYDDKSYANFVQGALDFIRTKKKS